jgi:hypothetical protein
MKKLLALVLALVMTLGLATVGTNAAVDTELKDADKISDEFTEAVDVVKAIDVMVGDNEGNFRPQDKLTRAEGAKIVAYLNATNKVAADLVGTGSKFSDMPADHWASGMVEYCAVNKILDGVGNGKFDPNGELKVVAFAKLMLTSLGYDSKAEGYVDNADWATHVMTRAQRIGLLAGLSDLKPTDTINREQAAQMLFNALKSPIVEYDQKLYTQDGSVLVGSSNAKPVTNEERNKQTIFSTRVNAQQNGNGAFVVEFAEQYYPGLVLTTDEDDFGRPANVWTYGRYEIGKWANKDLLVTTWTEEIKGVKVYDAIGALAYTIRNLNYNRDIYVDGVLTEYSYWNGNGWTTSKSTADIDRIAKDGTWLDCSGEGTLIELYVDDEAEYARLVVINTYLAQALTNYNANTKSISLGVYENAWDAQVSRTAELSDENDIADLTVGDYVLVTMTSPRTTDYEIQTVELAEAKSDVALAAYKSTSKGAAADHMTYVKLAEDSEFTGIAKWARYKQEILKDYSLEKLKNTTYDVYYDAYGNIIGIDYFKQDTNFVFVVGAEVKSSYIAYTTYTANLIWLDGTMQNTVVSANKNGTAKAALDGLVVGPKTGSAVVNAWFTYSKEDNGSIILNDVVPTMTAATAAGKTYAVYQSAQAMANNAAYIDIDSAHTTLKTETEATASYAYGNDKSVYITVGVDKTNNYMGGTGAINEVKSVSTGIKNTAIDPENVAALTNFNTTADRPSLGVVNANTYFLYSNKGFVLAAVVIGEDAGVGRNFVYVISGPTQRAYDGRYLDTYKVIKDGTITTIDVDTQKSGTTNLADKLAAKKLHVVAYDDKNIVVAVKDVPGTGLAVTPNTTINTDANKKTGYTYNTVASDADVDLQANTLVIKTVGDNVAYVLIGEKAKFFVYNPTTAAFEEYSDAATALTMAKAQDGSKQRNIVSIASVIEGATGFANTVIFMTQYAAAPAVTAETTVTVDATTGTITVTSKKALTNTEAANLAMAKLAALGYTDIEVKDNGGAFVFTAKKDGIPATLTLNKATGIVVGSDKTVTVTLDGTSTVADATKTVQDLANNGETVAAATGFIKVVDGVEVTFVDNATATATPLKDGLKITSGYVQIPAATLANYDATKLEMATSVDTNGYALKTATLSSILKSGAKGSGVDVGAGKYMAATATLAAIDAVDGTAKNGILNIATFECWALTVVDDTVGVSKNPVVKAYADGTTLNQAVIGVTEGTHMFVGSDTTATVITGNTGKLTADTTVKVGYVKIATLTDATVDGTVGDVAWSIEANDVVAVGSKVTATVTATTAYTATANCTVTGSTDGAGTVVVDGSKATLTNTSTSSEFSGATLTLKNGDKVQGTFVYTFTVAKDDTTLTVVLA